MEAAEPFFKRTWELVQEALDLLPKEVHGIKLKPPPAVRNTLRVTNAKWLRSAGLCPQGLLACWP